MPDEIERRVLAAVRQHALDRLLSAEALSVGLNRDEFLALCGDVFPEVSDGAAPPVSTDRVTQLPSLIAMLWSHRSGDGPWTRLMAGTIACAAFGARHLWQDLGAAGRPQVTALMERHFPTLAARNVRNLKWKHHLFQCLGAEVGMPDLRPPRCDGCEEQPLCFPAGPVEVTFRSRHGDAAAQEERAV